MSEDEILVYGEKRALVIFGLRKKSFKTISILNFSDFFNPIRDQLIDLKYLNQRRLVFLTKKFLIILWISKKNAKVAKKIKFLISSVIEPSPYEKFEKLAVLGNKSIIAISVQKMMSRSKIIVLRLTKKFEIQLQKTLNHSQNEKKKFSTLMPFEFVFDVKDGSVMLESRLSSRSILYSNLLSYKKTTKKFELKPFLAPINRYLDTQNLKLAKIGNCCWNIDIKGNLTKLEIISLEPTLLENILNKSELKKSERKKLKI